MMSEFDNHIKKEIQKYLNKNIHFTTNDEQEILRKKKKKQYSLYVSSLVFALILVFLLIGPVLKDEVIDNKIYEFSPAPFSTKMQSSKKLIEREDNMKEKEPKQNEVDKEVAENKDESDEKENAIETNDQKDQENQSADQNGNKEHQEDQEKQSTNQTDNKHQKDQESESTDKEQNEPSISDKEKEVILHKLRQFNSSIDVVIAELEPESYKFKNTFVVKEDVYTRLNNMMTRNVAEQIWSNRLEEKSDGLYLIPMDGEPDFREGEEYSITKLSSTKFKVTQTAVADLYGHYKVLFIVSNIDNQWKISDYKWSSL